MQGFPSAEQALADFFRAWEPKEQVELVPIDEAAWRVTAGTLYSENTLPVARISACDGIAVCSDRFADGAPDISKWRIGTDFVRADTGDDFEDRFDAVIAIEEVDLTEDGGISFISPDVEVEPGSNVRERGDSFWKGDLLIGENLPIRPTDLAALAMGGVTMVPVRKKPRAAFIPTGSELIPPQMRPKRGQNVDTNSLMAKHMLLGMGADPLLFPIVPDAKAELGNALDQALGESDIVIINAGSARGDEDFNARLLEQKGKLIHHYIAAAPGRPLALAVVNGKPVVNLPGPTMAAFFGLDWCVRAIINRYLRIPMPKRQRIQGKLMEDMHSTPHMAILCRMDVVKTANGYECYPRSFHSESLPLCMGTNAMYVSPIGESARDKGELIEVELLRGEEYLEGADGL
ncbi:MAG: molybdopterin molybdotransferase MoeA [Synergistaceae bacterium]|jgi:molybdopterin molybdotransferase/putative molybdopterin biosynthesis protein|nr:molybdopterin molybdotransferase MoeA [Synergistaceae bacterium]